jgi:hypothetical protein
MGLAVYDPPDTTTNQADKQQPARKEQLNRIICPKFLKSYEQINNIVVVVKTVHYPSQAHLDRYIVKTGLGIGGYKNLRPGYPDGEETD